MVHVKRIHILASILVVSLAANGVLTYLILSERARYNGEIAQLQEEINELNEEMAGLNAYARLAYVSSNVIYYESVFRRVMEGDLRNRYDWAHHGWIEWYGMPYYWTCSFKTVLGYAYYYKITGDESVKDELLDYINNGLLGGPHPLYNAEDKWFYSVYDAVNDKYEWWGGGTWADANGYTYPVPFIQAEGIGNLVVAYLLTQNQTYLDVADDVAQHIAANMSFLIGPRPPLPYPAPSANEIPLALAMLYQQRPNSLYLETALEIIERYYPKIVRSGLISGNVWRGLDHIPPLQALNSIIHNENVSKLIREGLELGAPRVMLYYRNYIQKMAVYEIATSGIMPFTGEVLTTSNETERAILMGWIDECWDLVFNNKKFDYEQGRYDYPESTDHFLGAHVWPRFVVDEYGKKF